MIQMECVTRRAGLQGGGARRNGLRVSAWLWRGRGGAPRGLDRQPVPESIYLWAPTEYRLGVSGEDMLTTTPECDVHLSKEWWRRWPGARAPAAPLLAGTPWPSRHRLGESPETHMMPETPAGQYISLQLTVLVT